MALDPIQEIHAIREQIMKEFDYDLDKLCDHLAAQGKDEGRVNVSLEPRRIKPMKARKAMAGKTPKAEKKTTHRKRSA